VPARHPVEHASLDASGDVLLDRTLAQIPTGHDLGRRVHTYPSARMSSLNASSVIATAGETTLVDGNMRRHRSRKFGRAVTTHHRPAAADVVRSAAAFERYRALGGAPDMAFTALVVIHPPGWSAANVLADPKQGPEQALLRGAQIWPPLDQPAGQALHPGGRYARGRLLLSARLPALLAQAGSCR
jgi:hypothetical protein